MNNIKFSSDAALKTPASHLYEFCLPVPDDDTVVAHNAGGYAASKFEDNNWDFSARIPGMNRQLHFPRFEGVGIEPPLASELVKDIKSIIFHCTHDESGPLLSIHRIRTFMVCLATLGTFALKSQSHLVELLSSPRRFEGFLRKLPELDSSPYLFLTQLHAILTKLFAAQVRLHVPVIPLKKLQSLIFAYRPSKPESFQTTPIPTRIYLKIIGDLDKRISSFEQVAEDFLAALRIYVGGKQPRLNERLIDYFHYFDSAPKSNIIQSALGHIRAECEASVLACTGMRAVECHLLPFNCLIEKKVLGKVEYWLHGITTKFSVDYSSEARWVTNSLGARAVRVMQAITNVFHEELGGGVDELQKHGEVLLFCGIGAPMAVRKVYRPYLIYSTTEEDGRRLVKKISPAIEAEDLEELRLIDPLRAWEAEKAYAVGQQWPLARHQWRRSLAVYGHGSGLVTFPALKRQLQHLVISMSRYYGKGSIFAKSLAKRSKHFSVEWRDEIGFSDFLCYFKDVVSSDEKLSGGHGEWAQRNIQNTSLFAPHSRHETIRKFDAGELAYKPSPIGGCASTGPCKLRPFDWVSRKCLKENCKNLVVNPTKLVRVTKAQAAHVKALKKESEGTIHYRSERNLLAVLKAAVKKYI